MIHKNLIDNATWNTIRIYPSESMKSKLFCEKERENIQNNVDRIF